MRSLLTISLFTLMRTCSKSNKDPETTICLNENYPSWLQEKMKSLSSCVCETAALLNKRKPLTLELARLFHRELAIPAEVLLA